MRMQFTAIFLALFSLFVSALSAPVALEERQVNTATFVKVNLLAPLNWVEGTRLFPSAMIAGYSAGVDEYDEAGYVAFILAKCQSFKACTSFMVYQGNNSGSTGGRYWFGHVFRGGATNPAWYERYDDPSADVTNSVAYTIRA